LRFGGRDFPLGEGRFLVGRSDDCDLCVEDPLASRHHAAIIYVDGQFVVQDLESRNGVFLNRARIEKQAAIDEGDVIRIGDLQMAVVKRRAPRAETLAQMNTQTATSTFRLLSGLADKALALGRGVEAERILERQLESVLERAELEEVSDATVLEAAQYAIKIASLTKHAKWVDYLFRLYARRGALMDAELVNELYALCPKVPGASRAVFRKYLDSLASLRAGFGPSERFVLSRLDSLEKQL
jgi:hypothetical protein